VLSHADAGRDPNRRVPGEDRRARVTFFLRRVPIGGVGVGPELFHIVETCPGFLEAEDVGLFLNEVVEKAFAQHRAQAIDVPRDQFHESRLVNPRPTGEFRRHSSVAELRRLLECHGYRTGLDQEVGTSIATAICIDFFV
jgi:hypothetical protein